MIVDDIMKKARDEIGYIEKSHKAFSLYGNNCLWPKTEYSGSDNYNKYALIAGHENGEPWCQSFIDAVLVESVGKEMANKLLCGKLSSPSTMEVKNAMVKAGREVRLDEAKPGDILYRSRSGGGHVGFCDGWENGELVSIEGNTSASDSSSWNGGQVARHVGGKWMWCVRPDWSLLDWHWTREDGIWYYQNAEGKNSYGWKKIKETDGVFSHWYYFNKVGQMLTGCQYIDGMWYFLMPTGPLEGACCKSDDDGHQYVWNL